MTAVGGPSALPLTGERTLPDVPSENYWFRRHQAAYDHLQSLAAPSTGVLLEIGAGEGYGAARLGARFGRAIALDYDWAAVTHLASRYPTLGAVQGNLAALPVSSGAVDAVASLQVIEHVWDHPQFVAECSRVLRPGGRLWLSTPNRLTFSPGWFAGERPLNPFHTHEFTAWELSSLVGHAPSLAVLAVQGLAAGPRLRELDARWGGSFVAAQLATDPTEWPAELATDVASVSVADFVVDPLAGEDCLDLILVAERA